MTTSFSRTTTRSTSASTSSRRLLAATLALSAGWLALPAAVPAAVELVASEPCTGGTCHQLAVACQELPARSVVVRQLEPRGKRGTAIFTVGGSGRGRYNKLEYRARTQQRLQAAGFEVLQVEWEGEHGFVTDAWGAGFKRALCGYAEVVRFIVRELAANPGLVCAQGNSGGSLQNAYGLAVYGLEDVLDMVVMSGGPPVTRSDKYCFPRLGREKSAAPGGEELVSSTGRVLIDRMMGWEGTTDHCKRVRETPTADVLETLRRDSLVPPFAEEARDFDYPATKINFVESADDPAAKQGRMFFDALASAKEWHEVEGRVHQVDNTEKGSDRIVELFLNECVER